jgi:hypothetical protein
MCRSIKMLFNFEPPVTQDEIRAASLQFVRKITGFHKPSKANEAAFLAAVEDIAALSSNLLGALETTHRRGIERKRPTRRATERSRGFEVNASAPVRLLTDTPFARKIQTRAI